MKTQLSIAAILLGSCVADAQQPDPSAAPTLEKVKATGALQSSYRKPIKQAKVYETPQADLNTFPAEIEPVLKKTCYECHGHETAENDFRVDTLDPDLLRGDDVSWWLEVSSAVGNEEMPPESGPDLADEDREKIIDWLSSEIQIASQVQRAEQGHSSFRRMTRYEYNYALQDLLGLEENFAKELPPDPTSEQGLMQRLGAETDTFAGNTGTISEV